MIVLVFLLLSVDLVRDLFHQVVDGTGRIGFRWLLPIFQSPSQISFRKSERGIEVSILHELSVILFSIKIATFNPLSTGDAFD